MRVDHRSQRCHRTGTSRHDAGVGSSGIGFGRPFGTRAILIATVTLAALVASCTGTRTGEASSSPTPRIGTNPQGPETTPSAQPVTDYASFRRALVSAGFTLRQGEPTGSDLFTVPSQALFIDDVQVWTYEYPDARSLDETRASISPDGYSVATRTGGIAMVDWVGTPHFYGADTLLVLYVGHNQRTLKALETLLGPQFAGG